MKQGLHTKGKAASPKITVRTNERGHEIVHCDDVPLVFSRNAPHNALKHAILARLISEEGRPVSVPTLKQYLEGTFPEMQIGDIHIYMFQIRKKLNEPGLDWLIQTSHGEGYAAAKPGVPDHTIVEVVAMDGKIRAFQENGQDVFEIKANSSEKWTRLELKKKAFIPVLKALMNNAGEGVKRSDIETSGAGMCDNSYIIYVSSIRRAFREAGWPNVKRLIRKHDDQEYILCGRRIDNEVGPVVQPVLRAYA